MNQRLRPFQELTKHLTARADDSHATLVEKKKLKQKKINSFVFFCFFAKQSKLPAKTGKIRGYFRIKPHAPPRV